MKKIGEWFKRGIALLLCVLCLISIGIPLTAQASSENQDVLKVAFYPLNGFFEYDEHGDEVGYGVEVLNMVSQYTGIQFEYVAADSWESTKQMLLEGVADLRMPGTEPAIPSTTLGYTQHGIIDTYYAIMTLKDRDDLYYEDYNSCRDALGEGTVDALISNIMDLDDDMKQLNRFSTVSNYLSMRIGDENLKVINDALSKIELNDPEFFSELYKKWFPDRVAVPFSKEETDYINSIDSLLFSFKDKQGYLARKQEDGTYVGFYPAMAKLICQKLGVKCEQEDFTTKRQNMPVVYTDFYYDYVWADQCGVSITQPYATVNYYELTRKNVTLDQKTCRVAAVKDYRVTEAYIEQKYEKDQITKYENYQECMDALYRGDVDVAYVSSDAAEYYLGMYRYSGISASLIEFSNQVCTSVYGDDQEIVAFILDKTIATISAEELRTILMEETAKTPNQDIMLEWIYQNPVQSIVAAIFVTIIALLIFLKRMQRKNFALGKANNARQEFLSRMSHDMRTPMNAIIGFSGFGQESLNLEEAKEHHGKIYIAARYLLQLINDSLDLTKLENGKYQLHLEACSSGELVEELENILREKAKQKDVVFEIIQDEKPFTAMFDKIRLQQIFVNLINNAIKYTPEAGHVQLIMHHEFRADEYVYLIYQVKDDGIGMSKEFQQQRLFRPFEQEQVNNDEPGTGLGLSIVKELIDAMGGKINCESEMREPSRS